jgi:hypothetical protein
MNNLNELSKQIYEGNKLRGFDVSKEYAEWYKSAYQKDKVISQVINKKQIFAYIERNLESEVVVLSYVPS